MEFDFTNTSSKGYSTLPVGKYSARTCEWWIRKKEDTGNLVLDIDVTILEGDFVGEVQRYFHTISNPATPSTLGYLYTMLQSIGIVTEDDRGDGGQLKVSLQYGDEDDYGRVEITAVEVNGEERGVQGLDVVAVVTKREGQNETGIKKLDPVGSSTKAPPAPEKSKPGKGRAGGKLPF